MSAVNVTNQRRVSAKNGVMSWDPLSSKVMLFGRVAASLEAGTTCATGIRRLSFVRNCAQHPLHTENFHVGKHQQILQPSRCHNLSTSAKSCTENKVTPNSSSVHKMGSGVDTDASTDIDKEIEPSLELFASEVRDRTEGVIPGRGPPPEIPTTCCASGCANCVWLDYAEDLKKYYKDGGTNARKAIAKEVEDPNLRAFLMLEIS